MKRPQPRSAFTLVELLVVVAVVGVLASLLTVAVKSGITMSQRVACASNMRQVGTALRFFANDNDGKLPYNYAGSIGPQKVDGVNSINDTWRVAQFLESYVGEQIWDCTDPLNRKQRHQAASRGIVWTKSSEVLSTDYNDPKSKRFLEYEKPASVPLFYCAYSPVNGPGTKGNRPWPHQGSINQLYLDGHVDGSYRPTWPD